MMSGLASLALPFLHALEPERAHELTLRALEAGIYPRSAPDDPRLAQTLWGLEFSNPVGIAAGFDKNARVADAILASGIGFAEVGTVTPRPQAGNPRPRVFRLPDDGALINRLGFNNEGHAAVLARLQRRRGRGVVGVNIGANRDSEDREADYVAGLEAFYGVADYFTVNVSSPNTPGLRDLQAPKALDALLARLMDARAERVKGGEPQTPIAVKLSPDIAEDDIAPIVACMVDREVDGVIVSNTTLARPGLTGNRHAGEGGGLSGRPLFHASTRLLAKVYVLTDGRLPLIGVGGIDSGEAALAKIEAGASLIQLYTGLVYQGPGLVTRIKEGLLAGLEQAGAASIGELTGTRARDWAGKE
jgi:dihydroorotate dehydrogenase